MHFAVGMVGSGAIVASVCLWRGAGWRWLTPVMTLGGLFAIVPDTPRLFREDFPGLPLASVLGHHDLERWLHGIGDVFFFHHALDAQPREFALHGLILVIALYNAAALGPWLVRRLGVSRGLRGWVRRGRSMAGTDDLGVVS